MPKATRRNIISKKKCPAALMAELIGAHMKLHDDLDALQYDAGDSETASLADRAEKAAMRVQMTASEAISFAPAHTLRGAVAKLVIALFLLGEIADDNDMDPVDIDRRDFLSRSLSEDAFRYLGKAHGITPDNLGLGSYVAEGPSETLRRARALVAKVTR